LPWSIDWPFKSLNNAGKVIKGPFVGALDLTPLLMKQKERPLALCVPLLCAVINISEKMNLRFPKLTALMQPQSLMLSS
jgi:hypothetical protein